MLWAGPSTLSDHALIDEMVAELNKNDGRLSAAVLAIVRSPQFRMIRGSEFERLIRDQATEAVNSS